jgi:hypothetical protein
MRFLTFDHSVCVCVALQWAQDGWTALILAAEYDHADCVRLLLDAGADKNAKTRVRG